MATRGNIATATFDLTTAILAFMFSDKTVQTIDVRAVANGDGAEDLYEKMPETAKFGLAHGLKQKISDSYASASTKGPEAGLTALAWAKRAAAAVIDAIAKGEWSRAGAGGGGEPALLVAALARVTGCTIDDADTAVGAQSEEEQKVLKSDPRIAAAIATIQSERAAARAAKAAETAAAATAKVEGSDLPNLAEQLGLTPVPPAGDA